MIRAPHATHRLAHLRAARPEDAAEELRAVLTEAQGNVAAAARVLDVTRITVHRWVTAWGLRAWLDATWPREERARRGWRKGRDGMTSGEKEGGGLMTKMTVEEIRIAAGLLPWAEQEAVARRLREEFAARGEHFAFGRRSGRTTRIICEGLAKASEGQRVRFLGYDKATAQGMTHRARWIAERAGIDPALVVDGATFSAPAWRGEGKPVDFEDHFRGRP